MTSMRALGEFNHVGDFKKLWDRYNESKQYKDRWLALYKDLYFYVIPDRNAFNVKWNYRDDGLPTTAQVWDNTAVLGAYQRANDLHALLLPKDRPWGKMVLDPHLFKQDFIDANEGLMDEINDRILFYFNQSNLARVVSSSNLDLIGGTGALWVESKSDDEPLYFRSIPSVCLYIEYSNDDVLNTCWYQCKMTGRQVLENFNDYKGIKKASLRDAPNEIVIVVYGQIKLAEDKFYLYAILEEDYLNPLWEADRSYNQIIIYRDRVRPGEADGRGIGVDLLPSIRDLNRIISYSRQNMAFKANPPLFYDSNAYFNPYSVRQWAGAMIQRSPGSKPLEAMVMPEYPDVLKQVIDLRETIQKGFMIDPLGEVDSPIKSATEISIRENRAQRTATTDISRLINELPAQLFHIAAKILGERRLLTKDRTVRKFNTKKMRFDFQSPLFDLQKQDDVAHFISNMQIKQQFYGQQFAVMSTDAKEAQKFLTDKFNLPTKLFTDPNKLQQMLEQVAQAAAQQAAPQPSTQASQVKLPQQSNTSI